MGRRNYPAARFRSPGNSFRIRSHRSLLRKGSNAGDDLLALLEARAAGELYRHFQVALRS